MTVKELREKRAALLARMHELRDRANDDKQEWRDEDQDNWKAVNDDYEDLSRQIQGAESRAAVVAGEGVRT